MFWELFSLSVDIPEILILTSVKNPCICFYFNFFSFLSYPSLYFAQRGRRPERSQSCVMFNGKEGSDSL